MQRNVRCLMAAALSCVLFLTGCGSASADSAVIGGGLAVESQGDASGTTGGDGASGAARQIVLTQTGEYPDYYQPEILATINTIQEKSSADSVSYIFMTDLHIDTSDANMEIVYRELNAAVDVANNSDVDFICIGGDLYNGRCAGEDGKETAMGYIRSISEILTKSQKPVFILHGNHDDNSFSAQVDGNLLYDADYVINKQEWYSVTMEYFSQYATDYQEGYYYYDLPGKNVRVVCLNMSDVDDTVVDGEQNEIGMYFYGYKDRQIDWLLNKAMSRQDCRYVFLSHDAFDYPEGYNEGSNREVLHDILVAAVNHVNYDDGKFSKDFSQWTGKPELYNCGHLHIKRIHTGSELGGIPLINSETSQLRTGNSTKAWGTFSEKGYYVTAGREVGTCTEALFDVMVSTPGRLEVIRFGAGDDQSYEY